MAHWAHEPHASLNRSHPDPSRHRFNRFRLRDGARMASLSRAHWFLNGELFFRDSPNYVSYLEHTKVFASDELIVIGIEDVDVLSDEPGKIDALTAGYGRCLGNGESEEAEPSILMRWMRTFPHSAPAKMAEPNVEGRIRHVIVSLTLKRCMPMGNLEVLNFVDEARKSGEDRGAILKRLLAERRWGGVVVSKDSRSLAIIVELQPSLGKAKKMPSSYKP